MSPFIKLMAENMAHAQSIFYLKSGVSGLPASLIYPEIRYWFLDLGILGKNFEVID